MKKTILILSLLLSANLAVLSQDLQLKETCGIKYFNMVSNCVRNNDLTELKKVAQEILKISEFSMGSKKILNKSKRESEDCTQFISKEKFGYIPTPFKINKFESDGGYLEVTRSMNLEEVKFTREELIKAEKNKSGWKSLGTEGGVYELWENNNVIVSLPPSSSATGGFTVIYKKSK